MRGEKPRLVHVLPNSIEASSVPFIATCTSHQPTHIRIADSLESSGVPLPASRISHCPSSPCGVTALGATSKMTTGQAKPQTLPLLPLGDNAVLLPGTTLRVPVSGRSDIAALLTSLYTRAKSPKPDAASKSIGCVTLNSPLLGPDGRNLIEDAERKSQRRQERGEVNPGDAEKQDLFGYGVVAKISGVQGRKTEDLALILEGTRRFKIDKVTQKKPYFQAQVIYLEEESALFLAMSRRNSDRFCSV